MTIPNVGVTGVIQDPGLGGVLAKGIGGITQLLMQQQQMRDKQARDAADIAYQNELTTNSRSARETAAANALAAKKALEDQEQRSRAAIEELAKTGALNAGQVAGLMQLDPNERAKKLNEFLFPQTLAEGARIVQPTTNGQFQTLIGPDTAMKATDNSTDFRNFLAGTINPATGTPYDPNTRPSQLSKEQAKAWVDYQRTLETVRAPKGNSMTVQAGGTFASGLGGEAARALGESRVAAREAVNDLKTIGSLKPLLDEGIISGFGANTINKFGSILQQFGIGGKGSMSAVSRTQAYAALVGTRVGKVITMFGTGTGLSDADREYATNIAGGNIELNGDVLQWLVNTAEKADRALANEHNSWVDGLPDTDIPPVVKRSLRVEIPPEVSKVAPSGKTYRFEGKDYPIIIGSDGKQYISTPKGTARVGG